jgi:tetratricopeptide (TPR) repeat protein
VAAIVLVAVLLGAQVARLTLADAFAETRPQLAARLAPYMPAVLVSQSMAQVGQAAALGETPPEAAMRRLHDLTRVAPLRPEPFLVEGAIAQREGNLDRAEQLLLEARRRDPRSEAARYLLADLWLRQGRISDGLVEMANLSRLLPGSSVQMVPALSEYARTPGASEQLRQILSANPSLKQPLLNALAGDSDNLQLVLELGGSIGMSRDGRLPDWQATLLKSLLREGAYERAYALWRRIAGFTGPRPLLFNPDFRRVAAPPPFNWNLNSSSGGIVEPADRQARVLFYGRSDTVLASQLLLLPPGAYRLAVPVSGAAVPKSLAWTVNCIPAGRKLIELEVASSAKAQGIFEVPAGNCPAQKLELRGRAQEVPEEIDVRIGPLTLERVG